MLQSLKHGNARYYTVERRRRSIRSSIIAVVILAGLLFTGGTAYTWYMSQQEAVEATPLPDVVSKAVAPKAPVKIADDAKVGISVQTLTSPVSRGGNSSISIKTLPTATCSIKFTYNSDKRESKDSGLIPKAADEFGVLSWTWTVTPDTQSGVWPVEVTCAHGSQSAYARGDVTVE